MIRQVDHIGLAESVADAQANHRAIAICPILPTNKTQLIESIAQAISAPSNSGRNWDALADLLSDFSGLLCLPQLAQLDERDRATLDAVIEAAQEKNSSLSVVAA